MPPYRVNASPTFGKDVGRRIAVRRMERGLSQTELGLLIGTSAPRVADLERGVQSFAAWQVVAVAQALQCSCDWLLLGTEPGQAAA